MQGAGKGERVGDALFSGDGSRFALGFIKKGETFGHLGVFDPATKRLLLQINGPGRRHAAAFTSDGKFLVAVDDVLYAGIWDIEKGYQVRRLGPHTGLVSRVSVSPDGKFAVTAEDITGIARLWDLQHAKIVRQFTASQGGSLTNVAFLADGNHLVVTSVDGSSEFLDTRSGELLCTALLTADRLASGASLSWSVVAPDGRFDTDRLDGSRALHWVVSDRPTSALPLEVFMRDYYEPRLLPRLLHGDQFPQLGGIGTRNRLRPKVEFASGKGSRAPRKAWISTCT
jgi:WD40 repeat protein